MPIHVSWFDPEQTILLQKLEGNWTIDDFLEVFHRSTDMLNTQDHKVDIIMDMSHSFRPPVFRIATTAQYVEEHASPNRRLAVVICDFYMQVVIKAIATIAPKTLQSIRFASTMKGAVDVIDDYREGLSQAQT